ncbi:Wzz/FepE/Etk N-terminal domain-containing protein [Staphylococcus pasteuri]|uniref:Wzz/FepE/Etk N-terminal domain-containing protein n=1 Tax=Staphylococcus pasteuri TaxID=45972 RepID=UPI001C259671|nr:Wzz/FepE/Etk N-terminal domain-containing protein [Staphylococcus pasteuri]MCO0861013.1 Wzz/FepE/Etk N-terminal domain-containing protein [Staphylococcus pasteuri]MCO5360119.1 Wzz/FepE/Etk N-terminal domain-containing protein [Staphylococcus pasteuri]
MEGKVDLSRIFKVLRKNIKKLITIPVIFMILSAIFTSLFVTPKYAASTQILVNQKQIENNVVNPNNVQNSLQSVNTYAEIIKSPRILERVSKELDYKYDVKELSSFVKVTNQSNSQIINVSIVTENAKVSVKIANKVAKVFAKEVPDIMDVDNVSVLSKASDTENKVAPNITNNMLLTGLAALGLTLLIIYLKHILDRRIKTEQDVLDELQLPVLGVIQKFKV